jgi:ATP-dependent Clp protease protease subunit
MEQRGRKESVSESEKHPLEVELLAEQVRTERAKAEVAEIDLAIRRDQERDRLVKSGKIRHLFINDLIISKTTDVWLDALQHWERRDPGGEVTLDIMSPGGSVVEGLALYDQLMRMRRAGHRITTRGVGMVASMAAVILQAGDERVMDSRAKLMLHEGSTTYGMGVSLTKGEQEDIAKFETMLMDDLLTILSERSTLTKRQLKTKWSRKDWYMNADEALKLGFVDRVE